MDTSAKMAPLVAHVAAFVRIVNASQTKELHQWTPESLDRAFAWANTMESLAEKAEKDDEAALDAALARYLQHAALPSMAPGDKLCVSHTLRNATRLVCDAVLTSAWLSTHPARAELTARVLKTRLQLEASETSSGGGSLSELVMAQIHTQQSLHATHKMTDALVRDSKPKRVLVRSAAFDVAPLANYTLQRRTRRLQSLARTLRANVCAAQALSSVDSSVYPDLLARVDQQLQQAQRDVVEVIVWAVVVDDWPPPSEASAVARNDLLQRVDRWIETQPMKMLLHVLAPWPAAQLARVSTVFARHYVAGLVRSGLHTLDTEELRDRVGALVLQPASELQALVDAQLDLLDPLARDQLLTTLAL